MFPHFQGRSQGNRTLLNYYLVRKVRVKEVPNLINDREKSAHVVRHTELLGVHLSRGSGRCSLLHFLERQLDAFRCRCVDSDEDDVGARDAASHIGRELYVPDLVLHFVEISVKLRLVKWQIVSVPPADKTLVDVADLELCYWVPACHRDSCEGSTVPCADDCHDKRTVFLLL